LTLRSWTPCSNWLENNNQHTAITFGTSWGKNHFETHILKFSNDFQQSNNQTTCANFQTTQQESRIFSSFLKLQTLTHQEA
jgi:hypothetical protein